MMRIVLDKETKKKILKFSGYTFLLFGFIFLYLSYSFSSSSRWEGKLLKDRIIGTVNKFTPITISIDDYHLSIFSGINFKNIRIFPKKTSVAPIVIDQVDLWFSPLSLLVGQFNSSFKVKSMSGVATGSTKMSLFRLGSSMPIKEFKMTMKDLSIPTLFTFIKSNFIKVTPSMEQFFKPIMDKASIEGTGSCDINFTNPDYKMNTANGKFTLGFQNLVFDLSKTGIDGLTKQDFTKSTFNLELNNSNLNVLPDSSLTSQDLDFQPGGSVNISKSSLDLLIKLKIAGGLSENIEWILQSNSANKDEKGFYNFRLVGPVNSFATEPL